MSAVLMRPEERVLDLLALLLDARSPVSTAQIFTAFEREYAGTPEARDRKFSRDKETLRGLGVPLSFVEPDEDDDEGGYIIDRAQAFLPKLDLTAQEQAALFAVGAAAQASAFPMRSELGYALTKLRTASTANHEFASNVVATPSRRPSVESTMMDAVRARRRLQISYPPESAERTVDPYAFSARRGRFLLVGYCHLRQGIRTFASDRVKSCRFEKTQSTRAQFEVPAGFDAEPHLPRHPWQIRVHPPVEVELSFTPSLADSGPRELGIPTSGVFKVTNLNGLVSQVLALGPGATILRPQDAQDRLLLVLDALAKAHEEQS